MEYDWDELASGEWRLWWRGLETGISPAGRTLRECVELLAKALTKAQRRETRPDGS